MDSSWIVDLQINPRLMGRTESEFDLDVMKWLNSGVPKYVNGIFEIDYADWQENFKQYYNLYAHHQHKYHHVSNALFENYEHITEGDAYFLRDFAEFFNGFFELEIQDSDGVWKFKYMFNDGAFYIAEEERSWGNNVGCEEFYMLNSLPDDEKLRRSI